MTARGRGQPEPLPDWLAWPIRALAVVFVVPVKLAWDLLTAVLRLVWRYVLTPLYDYVLRPFLHYLVWVPLRWVLVYLLWLPLSWIALHVLWVPLRWLGRRVLAPLFVALWHGLVVLVRALGPFWRLLGRVLLEVARSVVWAMHQLNRYVFRPLGVAVKWVTIAFYRYLLRPVGYALAFVWRYLVVPVATAVAWAWNHSVVLLWRYLVVIPVSWAWRTLVVPPARWVRSAVLHPIAETTRRVLATVGLR